MNMLEQRLAYFEAQLQVATILIVPTDIESQRGEEAQYRRAISGFYYACFYCLTQVGAAQLVSHEPTRQFASRAFRHKPIANFMQQQLVGKRVNDPNNKYLKFFTPASLEVIGRLSELFLSLQNLRHEADYDFESVITKLEAGRALNQARAFQELYSQLLNHHPDDLKTLTGILLFRDISVVL